MTKRIIILLILSLLITDLTQAQKVSWKGMIDSSNYYKEQLNYPKAIEWANQLQTLSKEGLFKDLFQSMAFQMLSSLYKLSGKLDSALFFATQCLELSRRTYKGNSEEESRFLLSILIQTASFNFERGNYSEAEALFLES